MADRPTLRPVTISRLIEATHLCLDGPILTETIEERIDVSHTRAREIALEASRIGLISNEKEQYIITESGTDFLEAVECSSWGSVSDALELGSPHYREFLEVLRQQGPASSDQILLALNELSSETTRAYNQTSLDVLMDWAERLGAIQRNAFTGECYVPNTECSNEQFVDSVLNTYDEMDYSTGISLRRQYVPIPELREHTCQNLQIRRLVFDQKIAALVEANIGRVDLLGAPIDTGAKAAKYAIRQIERSDDDGLVTTTQSSERTMRGVELNGKKYYYFVAYSRELEVPQTNA